MPINFNSALGVHPQALMLREKRGEILAANLANADTPDYKARDLDFKSAFKQALSPNNSVTSESSSLKLTNNEHLAGQQTMLGATLMYRNPQQSSLDGNTVEGHIEQAKYAENSVQYEASLSFLKGNFSDLLTAIKGQ
ncbi:flagellar basal body rod protein FlgB [Methylomonas sp. AM2-LC]|uniref:flagellar basal body rod protein FlgB n=1 Tax=Methylomonas sp. AM2-LC TaxID=3153301 RepID=UPI003265522D